MKTISNIFSVSVAVLFLVACSGDELMQKPIDDGNTIISLDDEVTMLPIGGEFTMAFTSNSRWSITDKPDWLNVNKSKGYKGTTMLTFSAGVNETRIDRTATMRFVANDGSFSREFVVKQPCPYLRVDTDSLSFDWNNGRAEREGVAVNTNTAKISISSNIEWRLEELSRTKSATIDMSNFAISTLSGENDSEVEFIPIRDNYSKEPYDIQVRLSPIMSDEKGGKVVLSERAADSYVIKLHQKNLKFLINDSTDDAAIEFSELNDDKNITFTIESEIPWKVSDCPEWIVMDKRSGTDMSNVNFQADGANPEKEVRTGTIRLSTDAGAYRDIEVSQRAYIFDIDQSSFSIGNDDTSERIVHLNTTGSWEISNIPSWLSVSPSEGMGSSDIVLKAKGQNLTFADYAQAISVKSTMNNLQESVSVSQDKFIFDISPDSQLSDLPTMNTSKYGVSIVSSGRWKVSGIPDWIDVDIVNSEKGEYNISVGANCGNPDLTTDRSATLVVTSLNHEDAGQEEIRYFTIKQRKYTFEVSETDFGQNQAYPSSSKSAIVKCSSYWMIENCPSWITPSITSGDGLSDAEISFLFDENLEKISRDETIVFKSLYNNETKTIRVAQDAFVFDNSEKSFDVPVMNSSGYDVQFDLTLMAQWNSTYDGWLHPSLTQGMGSGTVRFVPDPNPNLTERVGTAIITCLPNGESKTITFKQEKYVFDDSFVSQSFTELETTSVPLDIICSGPWTIKDTPSWLNLSKTSGISGEQVMFTPSKNIELTERSSKFKVVSTLNNLEKTISVQQDAFKFDSTTESFNYSTLEERSENISILCSGKWKITDFPSWISISSTSGNGSESGGTDAITLKSTKNLTETNRNGVVQIMSLDNPSYVKSIVLSQDKFDFRIDKAKFEYPSPLDVTSNVVNVVCPSDWIAESSSDWITLSSSESASAGSFILQPDANLTLEDRTATITVTSTLNQLKRELLVTQPKFVFNVGRSSVTSNYPLSNSCGSIDVQCSGEWDVETNSDWISLFKNTNGFEVTLSLNPNTSKRTGEIVVKSVLSGHSIPVSVSQTAYVFDNVPDNVELNSCPVASIERPVTCSGNWVASSSQDWLKVTPLSSTGNGAISITADSNPYETERKATIIVSSVDNTDLKKVFTVTQKGHVLTLDKPSINLGPYMNNMRSATISVTTSGQWSVSSSASWLKVNQSVSSGNGKVTLTADVNTSTMERDAIVTVKCNNTSLSKSLSIIQSGYVFDSSSQELSIEACPKTALNQTVTCSGEWLAESSQEWLKISPESGIGSGNISVDADINPTQSERTALITVTSLDNINFKKVYSIVQAGYEFTVTEQDLILEPYEVDKRSSTIQVMASGSWSVSSSEPWLKATQSVASGNGKVTLTAEVNTNAFPRTCTVVVKCSDTSLSHSITLTQGGYVFNISETSHVLSDAMSAEPFSIAVGCSGNWTAVTDADWLSLNFEPSVLIVVPQPNTTVEERTATISFNSAGHSLACIVKQNPRVLE